MLEIVILYNILVFGGKVFKAGSWFSCMIIGLTGPICAGKDEVAKVLVKLGFRRLSLSDEIRTEMQQRNILLTRENIQDYGDSIRRHEGAGAWARKVIAKINPEFDYVVDSIRNPGEVEEFRKIGNFHLIKIYAPSKLRFARMVKRGREQDPGSFSDFEKLEMKDLGIGQPDYGQQHAQCFALADKEIINEGTLEKLAELVEELFESIKHKSLD